ncbi:MAG: hypothetical protein RIQ89_1097 [Bacteroidota bacterium]|jgi:gamma-D-glutamyl-L-lysine dipeptidyl-peptidase
MQDAIICHLSVIPIRREPNDRSEIVTQLLFGERAIVVEENWPWLKVKLQYDDYEGWLDHKQVTALSDEEDQYINALPITCTYDIVQIVSYDQRKVVPVVLGSTLPCYKQPTFSFNNIKFAYEGMTKTFAIADKSLLMENAYMYLNAPYLWGGRTPFGIDCSGFTQQVYKLCGIKILRDASQQATQGRTLNNLNESLPGDLAFFQNKDQKIIHVGIILPGNKIIHASGNVRIDKITERGIYNEEAKRFTHELCLLKNISA